MTAVHPRVASRPVFASDRLRTVPVMAVALGLVAGGVAFVGAGVPSYWGDEAASVMSASRSLPSLFGLLAHIDAVHGLYYLFLHFWIQLFGSGEAVVRLPSAIAVATAVAGVVVLTARLYDPFTAATAGAIAAVIPQLTRMAVEARSYAFAMAVAVWLTVLFVMLLERTTPSRRLWVAYAVGLAASVYLFLYLGLLLLVHAVVLLAKRPGAAVIRRWAAAATAAAVLAAPMAIIGYGERGQIAFLSRRDYATATSLFVRQWFSSWPFAIAAWTLIAIAIVGAVLAFRRSRTIDLGVVLAVTWTVLPTALLLIGDRLVTPMYDVRYPTFCVPGVALLMAIGARELARLARGRRVARAATATVIVAALAAVSLPTYVAQRQPFAKDGGSDLRQSAQLLASLASPGDAVVFDQTVKPSRRPRLAKALYPTSFAGLADVALTKPYAQRHHLWDGVAPLTDVEASLAAHHVVWAVELDGSASNDVAVLESLGYDVAAVHPVHRTNIVELVKE